MSARIVCDVSPRFHRFDLAVVEDDFVPMTLYERAAAMHGAQVRNEGARPRVAKVYERCALSEIVVARSITKIAPTPNLFRGATFPRYGKHFSPRRWLAAQDPELDVLIVTGSRSYVRAPADRVVVLAHHMPEV